MQWVLGFTSYYYYCCVALALLTVLRKAFQNSMKYSAVSSAVLSFKYDICVQLSERVDLCLDILTTINVKISQFTQAVASTLNTKR